MLLTMVGGGRLCLVAFECRIYIHNYSCWLDLVLGNSFEWPSFCCCCCRCRFCCCLRRRWWWAEQSAMTIWYSNGKHNKFGERELFSFHRFAFKFSTWKLKCCHAERCGERCDQASGRHTAHRNVSRMSSHINTPAHTPIHFKTQCTF